MRKENTVGFCRGFCWLKNMTKRWREISSLQRVFIASSKSPSSIKEEHPIYRAKEIARATAKALTTSEEKGRGICSDSAAMVWPWLSRITTPNPTLPISLNVAPSKFTFQKFEGGGDHLLRVGTWVDTGVEAVLFALCWNPGAFAVRSRQPVKLGNLHSSLFLRNQIVHSSIAIFF